MARIRQIKPEASTSPDMAALSREARLFFLLLLTEADDFGRLLDSPKRLAGCLFPHDEDVTGRKVGRWLEECIRRDMVRRYGAEDLALLGIVNFRRHQKIHNPTPSKFPNPPWESPEGFPKSSGENPKSSGGNPKRSAQVGVGVGVGVKTLSSSTSDSRPATQPVDDDDDRRRLKTETLDLLGKRHLAARMTADVIARKGPVGDVVAWQAADRGKTLERHGERLKALTAGSAAELAELLEPTPRSATVAPPPFEPSEAPELPALEAVRPNLERSRAALLGRSK